MTLPLLSTVATVSSSELQDTDLFVAFDGLTVATSVSSPPIEMEAVDLLSETPVTATGLIIPPALLRYQFPCTQ